MEKPFLLLEFDKVLVQLSRFAVSEEGKKRCLKTPVYTDVLDIEKHLGLTKTAKKLIDTGETLPLNTIKNIVASLEKSVSFVTLEPEELFDVAENLRTTRLVKTFLERNSKQEELLIEYKEKLFPEKDLEERIFRTFDSKLNVVDDASVELKRLKQIVRNTENNIKESVSRLLSNKDFLNKLQDTVYTQRDGRVVFQVKAEFKNKMGGIVHDVSSTAQTYFIEPKELVSLNNKLRETENLIYSEIEKILKELTALVAAFFAELKTSFETLVELDFIFAKAKYAISIKAAEPEISKEKLINLKSMKNPILMEVKDKIVENDFFMDEAKNVLIITGSNTGGKTVAIKTAGLCVLMMKAGLWVPCFAANIFPFEKVFADIGDEQSIVQSLSTFSSHMKNIISIVNNVTENSLVILDEICTGTDPKEGFSLAFSILEYLQKTRCFTIVTTHYGELKSMAYLQEGFQNASVEFDLATLSPSYKLLIGLPGVSNAIIIAKNLGLKNDITQKADYIYHNQEDETAKVLEELHKTQQSLSVTEKEALELKKSAIELELQYKKALDEIKSSKKKTLQVFKKKYETQIENLKSEMKDIQSEIHKETSEKVLRRSFERLSKLESAGREDFYEDEQILAEKYIAPDWESVRRGDKLMIKDVEQPVEILELPDKNNNVKILMGQLKTTIKASKLVCLTKNAKKVERKKERSALGNASGSFSIDRTAISYTLDLRGKRAQDALDELDIYLDKASLSSLSPVYIIHGHGTGALKSAVREYLAKSAYVKKFEPAEQGQGGDGVSIVDLR